ncbi:PAS domain S-box-containing protein [Christiangramia gaetbulicola]|uniref:histidine kinase n=1 Tax=Christiangramia gaetbulicola TaxID=703340 RepID=A0A2T6AK26_9FLAO|nr:PAS domain S-box protein [Christiangramia gaetbulicola]PTX44170.1 PAS domain S-box-containing protein [Christiangramia gaetbulicola]
MLTASDFKQNLNLQGLPFNIENALEDLPIPVLICDNKGDIIYFNTAFNDVTAKKINHGDSIFDEEIIQFLDTSGNPIPANASPIAQIILKKESASALKVFLKKKGDLPHTMVTKIHTDASKEILAFQFSFSPQAYSEKRNLKRNTLSAIVESSNDAIISKDLNGTITSWNKGAEKIFGYTEKEILGKKVNILIPKDRISEEKLILKTIKSGKSLDHLETRRLNKTGKEISISLTVSPIKDIFGNIIGASKVARDISERLKGDERQARLSAIVESSDDAIVSKDLNGTITSWNRGAKRIFGYSEAEVLGKSITILIPKERLDEEKHILKNIASGKRINHFETIRLTKDGRSIHVSLSVSPLKDRKGKIVGASKIARNIEDQVRSKKKIESYVEKLRILNSVGKDISSKLDLENVLQKVTDATTTLSGAKFGAFFYNTEVASGESMMLYTLSGAPKSAFEKLGMPRHTAVFQPTFSGQGVIRVDDIKKDERYGKNEPIYGMPNGHLEVTSYMAVPVVSNSGKVIGGLIFGHPEEGVFKKDHEVMVRNIAAQAAIALDNSQLFERVKTLSEKKDEFIALASHELKTPLTTIKGYLQILEKKISEPKSRLFLNKTLDQANRLNTLIDDLLNMSRIEAGKLEFNYEDFDIRELLLDVSETFNYSENKHELITDFGDLPVLIHADKQRIEQVINNLLSNAVKYSPLADKVYLNLKLDQGKAKVTVKDQGLGLTQEQQQKVFTRFYRAESTKGINGLGLGLYLTKQIMDAHDGMLDVKSEEGIGSEFYFTLPLAK